MMEKMLEHVLQKKMFGKEVEIAVFGTEDMLAEDVMHATYLYGLQLQSIFNFYDPASELSQLNKKRKMVVSQHLLKVLKKALLYCKLTKGRYDISLGKLFHARKKGGCEPLVHASYQQVSIINNTVVLKHPDLSLDLGSVAKGYIVDQMVGCLKNEGVLSGLVDGRGDIRAFGEEPQHLGIQHPREKDSQILSVIIQDKAIATSGDYRQYASSFDKSHIINKTDIISATVIAPELMEADIFATLLCVSEDNAHLMKSFPHIAAVTIDKDLQMTFYNGFEKYVQRYVP